MNLTARLDHRNNHKDGHKDGHTLCIEDPIGFLHQHKRSVIDQREVRTLACCARG
jgi:twitching motility protein PilU